MLDLVFKNYTSQKNLPEKFFRNILAIGLKTLKLNKKQVEISVNLVGDSKMRSLNKKYRNKDRVTDVLSFPLEENFGGRLLLGDVFICLSFAKKQAKRENIDIEDKLAQLMVHGFLHLLGYGHEKSSKNAKKMFKLENKILKNIK